MSKRTELVINGIEVERTREPEAGMQVVTAGGTYAIIRVDKHYTAGSRVAWMDVWIVPDSDADTKPREYPDRHIVVDIRAGHWLYVAKE